MKLAELTPKQKLVLLAELDGMDSVMESGPINKLIGRYCNEWQEVPSYLTSYDAIVPLIQKQPMDIRIKAWNYIDGNYACTSVWGATPSQLGDALLIATGKATNV
jgi:hypothetical protein